jgi:hypothetical protein
MMISYGPLIENIPTDRTPLRARRERPCRRAAEQRDELASPHSITSSARASCAEAPKMTAALIAEVQALRSELRGAQSTSAIGARRSTKSFPMGTLSSDEGSMIEIATSPCAIALLAACYAADTDVHTIVQHATTATSPAPCILVKRDARCGVSLSCLIRQSFAEYHALREAQCESSSESDQIED